MSDLIKRDRISGQWVTNDIEPGEYSGDELSKRVRDQQKALNKAVIADWDDAFDTSKSKTLAPARRQLKTSIAETSKPVA